MACLGLIACLVMSRRTMLTPASTAATISAWTSGVSPRSTPTITATVAAKATMFAQMVFDAYQGLDACIVVIVGRTLKK